MISEAEVVEHLVPLLQQRGPSTFFEITTLLAFLHFAKRKVDVAVLETGLGGRLDATNVVTPILSVITSISLEHTDILGNSIEEIAKEKGGIIKQHVPVVIGPKVPLEVIHCIAEQSQAPLTVVSGTFSDYHAENSAIAKQALELLGVSPKAIQEGCNALPPCRMETHLAPCTIILDVAHNPDGLQALFKALTNRFPRSPFRVLCGLSKTKDIDSCLKILAHEATNLTFIETQNGRGAPVADLMDRWATLKLPPDLVLPFTSIEEMIQLAKENEEILVVCGTFFIMSQVRQALGIIEPVDPIDMNERFLRITSKFKFG
jgi:dihydrofolate synthase/folylpolyglutamate synthase